MLPPILEIYVVWHPHDKAGEEVARTMFKHFHGTVYTGLIGGAVEIVTRSSGWTSAVDAPRPIPFFPESAPNGIAVARLIAVVPVLGTSLAAASEDTRNPWFSFVQAIVTAQNAAPNRIGIFPLSIDDRATNGTNLGSLLNRFQRIGAPSDFADPEPAEELWCRDLAQGIAQLASGATSRLQVFLSHTKRALSGAEENIFQLIDLVRKILGETRLQHFFDANDLQPGRDWDETLRAEAARSALLALRTDLYASREWCQREMLIAKCNGMPIVTLDSLDRGEDRGSFLMDHVPRVPVRHDSAGWSKSDVRRGLNLLVDECLKRALWNVQKDLARTHSIIKVSWWAPHAPEPVTFTTWLRSEFQGDVSRYANLDLRILHPDPPLGNDEKKSLEQLANLMGHKGRLEVMTPRLFAARGG